MARVKMNSPTSTQALVTGPASHSSRGLSKRKASTVSLYQRGECPRKFCAKAWLRGLLTMDSTARKRLKMPAGLSLDQAFSAIIEEIAVSMGVPCIT